LATHAITHQCTLPQCPRQTVGTIKGMIRHTWIQISLEEVIINDGSHIGLRTCSGLGPTFHDPSHLGFLQNVERKITHHL
jgi:hypothetical protein